MYHQQSLQLCFKALLNFSRFSGRPIQLKIIKSPYIVSIKHSSMASKRSCSTSTSSIPQEDQNKKLKPSELAVSNSKSFVSEEIQSVEIQRIKDDPSRIESMTVQELRTTLRNVGMPAKGRKSELISSLKCFLCKNSDDNNSKEPEKHVNSIDAQIVKTKEEFSIETMKVSVGKASETRRKVSSDNLGAVSHAEPWAVLAHKKPQKNWVPYNPRTMRPPPPAKDKFVKLMSWNVNGLRALLKLEGFSAVELAERENFDVLCIQETKLQEKDVESIKQCLIDGYENSFWTCSRSKLGYSGTAIVSRVKPLSVSYGLGIEDHDSEGRLVTAEFDSFYLINAYVPNSGDGLKRLSYRVTEWDLSLSNYMKELEKSKPVILTGDLNCAHQEIDIYNPSGNRRSAGFTDEERQSFEANFLSRGFVDTFRKQHPNVVGYTYWGYRHGGRKTNKGWRLDYFLASESIADQVHDSYIVPDILGSDHCPIGLVLKV